MTSPQFSMVIFRFQVLFTDKWLANHGTRLALPLEYMRSLVPRLESSKNTLYITFTRPSFLEEGLGARLIEVVTAYWFLLIAESYGIPSLQQCCIRLIAAWVLTNPVHVTELLGETSSVFPLTTFMGRHSIIYAM